MLWFCKPKPLNVYFYTTRQEVFDFSKPERFGKAVPEWYKSLPPPSFPTDPDAELCLMPNIKTCAGFQNLYKSGFVFKLWSDLNVEINTNGTYRYQFADKTSAIKCHPSGQLGNCEFKNSYAHLKLMNPWFMSADKDVNFMFTPPTWNGFGYGDIVVPPGAYSPHVTTLDANINLFFKVKQSTVIHELKFGQPLVHVVPLTERRIKLHYELISEQELHKIMNKTPFFLMGHNRFNRTKKLCSHV
jgi:hypothetical protein